MDENNAYIHTVNTTVVAFQAAERKTANAIEALVGGQQWHVITDPNDKSNTGFGYASIPDDAKTPWGADVEKKGGCLKETMKAGWHFAEGFGEGAWGAVKGIGALTGIEGWDAFKASWKGMENLALVVVPVAGVAVWGTKGYAQHATALGKGLTDWDEWKKNPAKALGNVTFSVLTVAVPGAGEAGVAGKAGEVAEISGDAAKASKLAIAADVGKTGMQTFTKLTDPFHYAAQLPKVADFATGLDLTSIPVLAKFGGADRSGLTNTTKTFTADGRTAAATVEREPALAVGRSGDTAGNGAHQPSQSPAPPSGGGHGNDNGGVGGGAGHEPTAPEPGTPTGHDSGDDAGNASGASPVTSDTPRGNSDDYVTGSGHHIPRADYEATFAASVHNAEAERVMLGRFTDDPATNYINRAGTDHTYFDLGKDGWNATKERQGLDDDGMFSVYNKRFLSDAVDAHKPIDFSHDPTTLKNKDTSLHQEFEYLVQNGYVFDANTQSMLPPSN